MAEPTTCASPEDLAMLTRTVVVRGLPSSVADEARQVAALDLLRLRPSVRSDDARRYVAACVWNAARSFLRRHRRSETMRVCLSAIDARSPSSLDLVAEKDSVLSLLIRLQRARRRLSSLEEEALSDHLDGRRPQDYSRLKRARAKLASILDYRDTARRPLVWDTMRSDGRVTSCKPSETGYVPSRAKTRGDLE